MSISSLHTSINSFSNRDGQKNISVRQGTLYVPPDSLKEPTFKEVSGVVASNPRPFDVTKSNFIKSDNLDLDPTQSANYIVLYYYSLDKSKELYPPPQEILNLSEDDDKYRLFLVELAQGIGGGRIIIDASKSEVPSRGDKITFDLPVGDHAYPAKIKTIEQTSKSFEFTGQSASPNSLKNSNNEAWVSRADNTDSDSFPTIDIASGAGSPYPKAFKVNEPPTNTIQGKSVEYSNYIKFGGSLAWRNNNPGNMRLSKEPKYYGALSRDEKRFLQFSTEKDGFDALLVYIKTWKNASLEKFINQYAPPNENNTSGYLEKVSIALQTNPSIKMSELDDNQRYKLALEIKKIEGWKVGKIKYKDGGNINSVGVI